MSKIKDVASTGNLNNKQVKHKSIKNNVANNAKNVSLQSANNASGRLGVAAVALASTLSMVLPGATALAKTSFNADSFDSSYVNSVAKASSKGAGNGTGKGAGKGNGEGNGLYKNGLLNTGATSDRAMRQMVDSVLVKNDDSNINEEGVKNQETVSGDSSVGVKDSGEFFVTNGDSSSPSNRSFDTNNFEDRSAASNADSNGDSSADNNGAVAGSNNGNGVSVESSSKPIKPTNEDQGATKSEQNNSDLANPKSKAVEKEQPAEAKPAEAPSANSEIATKTDSASKAYSDANTEPNHKPAKPTSTENTNPVAKNGKEKTEPATENTDSDNTKTAAEQPADEQSTSTTSTQPAAKSENDFNTPRVRVRRDANQNAQDSIEGSSVTTEVEGSSADAGNTTNLSAENSSVKGTAQGSQSSAQGSQSSAEGTNTGIQEANKNGASSATGSASASESRSASNDEPTPSPASTPNNGTTTNNAAIDANSQVIKPNEQNQTAETTDQANGQVQTDKKPKATYNLKIRYTIGGAANKQLVQPYELTIDKDGFDKLGKDGKYEYIELPKSAGYRPSVYHSGTYQYYVKKGEGDNSKYVIDDGTDANAVRCLRLDKNLIKEYAVKKRQAVESNNSAQSSQNPSSTQSGSDDGIQYYGELNINYAPKTAKYYVRHLLQDLDHKDEFHDAPNLGIGKVITVKHKDGSTERIHVTEITGTVGSDVSAVSTYIPGYEPEHNLISSQLSDSEDEKDKLILNLRYYRKAYEVTYDSDGGTDVTAQKVYYGQEVPKVPEPTYRGHTFMGWQLVKPGESTDRSSTSNRSVIEDESLNYKMPDHNVQFRAAWLANAATSYRVNVWVQKADLVDKEHPNSLANYDFVGLVERKNVQTDSDVALDNMDDAGVANDTSKLNGESVDDYVENPELGLTKEELQGTKANKYKDGLIEKFNWMNDTHVTDLDGYDTENPDDPKNYTVNAKGERVYKDNFTRYFHVNKELTKKLNTEEHYLVPGRSDLGKRSKSKLCADDLNNTLNLVYDRKTYELIFAKPAGVVNGNNAAIKRKDEHGNTTIYCYAGGGNCSDKYDKRDKDDDDNTINHKGYRVNVRYGQKLTDIWPDVNELDFNETAGSLGWQIGYAGEVKYRDTPPYRFTKEEFADPRWRAAFKKNPKDKVIPKISDDPEHNPQVTHELKDNQRLLTADKSNQSQPIQVIIRKQSIASAKKGGDISEDDYELSTDSYSKDDTPSGDYDYPAPSIAGFNPADGYDTARVGDALDEGDFKDNLEVWYNESHAHGDWDDLSEDEQKDFAKKYHLAFRKYRGVPVDEQENYHGDEQEFDDNKPLEFKYNRQSPDVQFYNADGNAIKDSSGAATEKLPFEYSLTKRGKKDLTGEDKELYGNDTSYDASVVKDNLGVTSKQFDGKYTFTLNNKTYSIVRPDDLPKDYVFKGWAVDQAGIHLINGEINDNSEDTEGASEAESKDKGEVKDITMPVNGIKLYAAWGAPKGVKHTVTIDYDMPRFDDKGNVITDSDVTEQFTVEHRTKVVGQQLKVPTRKGYDFYGWELAKKGNEVLPANTPYAFGNKVVEDITLRAVWVKDTRYNGTFKHIFLKPGYTIADYKKDGLSESAKAAMVDHISTQTVSGLREHLRYNAEAVYSDETHFPDKHFTSFEASSDEDQNTGEFIYQTYNTRKYRVRYVTIGKDGKEKDLLPESEVSSVNQKYDVVFYKQIKGFMPENTQNSFTYKTDEYGKQDVNKIPEITFKYKDVRVLKRKYIAEKPNAEKPPYRPDHYTRYVFKVADDQGSMGSVVDWQGSKVADGSALVYDAIKGTKAYQMPLPTVKAKPGFEFAGWTSQIGSYAPGSAKLDYATGLTRLPKRSEEQNSPEVIYTANFKLKAPVATAPQVLTPTENISTTSSDAKKLITNADEYPNDATFSFAGGATFDKTPGLHKIKVQVHLDGNTAEAEVLYRVLPDLVYASDWEKFSQSDYGKDHINDYAPITFTGKNDEGTIIGHDTTGTTPSTVGTTTLTAYVYKGKDVRIRVPQAFGKDHSRDNYHYVFKGWATKVVEPTTENPKPKQKYDIDSEGRYKDVNVKVDDNSGKTYHAVYKKIEYFSSSSDGGEVPKDAVVAIFKPAPGRKWNDDTSGPKVFYVKKGTDLEKITKKGSGALAWLNKQLTGAKGTWSRSSMLNDGIRVDTIPNVAKSDGKWKVNEPFQEFVADQTPWTEPDVRTDYLVAVQDKRDTLPKLDEYLTNLDDLKKEAETKGDIKDVTIEYDLPKGKKPEVFENKMLSKPSLYTVPLKITVNYKDGEEPKKYKRVARLKVIYQLMYPESISKKDSKQTDTQAGANAEHKLVFDKTKYVSVNFINAQNDNKSPDGKGKFAAGSRDLYYAYKQSASGVRAPQVIGKDYDAQGYHYEFKGWEKQQSDLPVANLANTPNTADGTNTAASVVPVMTLFAATVPTPTTVQTPLESKLYSSSEIAGMKFNENTTFVARYKLVPNVIDASKDDKIPDGYVATIFLPKIGHRWSNGDYKPKLLYIRHGKDIKDNIKFSQKVASDTGKLLSGFVKWRMHDAKGNESNIYRKHAWDIETPRILVAEQTGISDIKIPETVIGVGDAIPNLNKLVHNTDPNVNVSINHVDGQGEKPEDTDNTRAVKDYNTYVYNPGTATVTVDVTRPTDEIDSTGEQKTITTKVQVRVHVLPNVIADNDLPAEGTAAAKFIEKNYTKVTYVAGKGGSLQKSPLENAGGEPVSVYWVRNDATDLLMQVPDVLADNGYVFKDWTVNEIDVTDNHYATAEEREALARLAKIDGMHYVAKLISDSHNSTLAALQNLLNEARKSRAEQVYNAKREELARIAESKGNTDLASVIRKSNGSLQNIKNMLTEKGIDVDEIVENAREKALLVKLAKEAGKTLIAEQISNSKRSSIEALKNLMREAGIDLTFADYEETNKSNVSDEQRELLAKIAYEADKPELAMKILKDRNSTLQDLKKLFADAGVDLYAIPAVEPKKEITITANFELMKPMRFEFRSSAVLGIPATFTLVNLTENSSGNKTVSVGGVNSPINALTTNSLGSNGLLPSCNGTTCKISGTPKIVDGKPKVELTFTTVDQYGRSAEIVVYIDVVDSEKPDPTPDTTPVPTSEPDYSTVPSDYVVPAYEPEPVPVVPLQDKQKTGVKGDLLPQTGVDASQSALIASLLASVGFAGFAAKHRRKREDGKND